MAVTGARDDALERSRRRRLVIGAGLLAVALGVDVLLQYLFAPPHFASPARLALTAFQFIAVVLACGAANAWSERRGHGPTGRILRAVLAAGITSALLTLLATQLVPLPAPPHPFPMPRPATFAMFGFVRGVVVCGLWALGFVYPLVVEAERARVDAELARLRSHLEPHFLLNSLNLIAGLVGQDPDEARRLIGCLGELLADAVESPEEDGTVADEVAWLQRYADILVARHPDLLHVDFDVSPRARGQRLPRLLLQPLVENAAKHGVLAKAGGGTVTVRADVDDARGELVCTVSDDGRGFPEKPVRKGAFGLLSVRRRLSLERPGSSFTVGARAGGGTESIVRIPLTGARSR